MEELNNFHRVIVGKEAEPLNRTQELIKELAHAHTKVYVEQQAIAEMNFTSSEVPVIPDTALAFDKRFTGEPVTYDENTTDDLTLFIVTDSIRTESNDTGIFVKGPQNDVHDLKVLFYRETINNRPRLLVKYGDGNQAFWTYTNWDSIPSVIVVRVKGGDFLKVARDSSETTFTCQRRFPNPTKVANKNITGEFRVVCYNKYMENEEVEEIKRSLLITGAELEPLKYVELRQMDGTIKKYKLGVG